MMIGFAYQAQTGKTTASKYLENKYGFKRDNFAFSLKEGIGKHVFGLTQEQMTDPVLKETVDPFWGMTPRRIMQRAGTEAMRNTFRSDIWIMTLQRRVNEAMKFSKVEPVNFAIDDVRFADEADAIKAWGGKVIWIQRGEEKSIGHLSELDLQNYKKFDYVLDNNGTFESLYIQLDKIVKENING